MCDKIHLTHMGIETPQIGACGWQLPYVLFPTFRKKNRKFVKSIHAKWRTT